MYSLFDNTERKARLIEHKSNELKIKSVLNPFTRTFIDEHKAKNLGIILDGYYRNRYGGLIPIHIAANKGYIQYSTNTQIEVDYLSKSNSMVANLIIYQVYDHEQASLISCRQAIDKGYINLEQLSYLYLNVPLQIHDAYYRGFLIGDLQTYTVNSNAIHYIEKKYDYEYDDIFSSLTNITNSLSEFRNAIHISNACEVTSDGFIRHKKNNKHYLLSRAMELGFVSIKDSSCTSQLDCSDNVLAYHSIMSLDQDEYSLNDNPKPYFSETFMLDLLMIDDANQKHDSALHSTSMKRSLPIISSC